MALNATLLRDSFALVTERQPQIVHRFYEILFDRYPQARALFGRNSQARQEEMLGAALVAVLDHLEDASWLGATLKQMGGKHVEYGVTDEMYGWVSDSLMSTFAEVGGRDWTPAHTAAWSEALGAITSLMKAGAAERR
jgi:hemoglobin-like flavoprotein